MTTPETAGNTPAATPAAPASDGRKLKGLLLGVVTSDKRDKSRTVNVTYQVRHPKYGKYLHKETRYQVHDPRNESKLGDQVEIANCRPISKTKSWRLVRVLKKSAGQAEHVTEAKV